MSMKATVNNSEPFILGKNTTSDNKTIKELFKVRSQENQVMISKMLHIRQVDSPYSLQTCEDSRDGAYKPSNIGQKILDMRQLIENNEGIEKRIKEANPVINFSKIKIDYRQNKKYLKNLSTNSSRRIFNCFLPKPHTATNFSQTKFPAINQQTQSSLPKSQKKLKKVKKGKKKHPIIQAEQELVKLPPSQQLEDDFQKQKTNQMTSMSVGLKIDQLPAIQITINAPQIGLAEGLNSQNIYENSQQEQKIDPSPLEIVREDIQDSSPNNQEIEFNKDMIDVVKNNTHQDK